MRASSIECGIAYMCRCHTDSVLTINLARFSFPNCSLGMLNLIEAHLVTQFSKSNTFSMCARNTKSSMISVHSFIAAFMPGTITTTSSSVHTFISVVLLQRSAWHIRVKPRIMDLVKTCRSQGDMHVKVLENNSN